MNTVDFLFWAFGKAMFIAMFIALGIWLICLIYKYSLISKLVTLIREPSDEYDISLDWVDETKVRKLDASKKVQRNRSDGA